MMQRIQVIDSHTGGEPTRVVLSGGPELGGGTLAERRGRFRELHDAFRSTVANEPRGSDAMLGALLVRPTDSSCVAVVIFFNNFGTLGMCGHGMIGLGVTLGHLGKIGGGVLRVETPVGVVAVEYDGGNGVAIENVASYRHAKDVAVTVPGFAVVMGDIAWGGNWFFLIHEHGAVLERGNIERLTVFTSRVVEALASAGITGKGGEVIDHIELVGPPADVANDARNFVLCPGKAYDRSPCGTGTSAKMACLHAEGKLQPGEVWRQESILGSVFEGSIRVVDDVVYPRIRGTAYVTAEATLLVTEGDPFAKGIR